MIAPKPQQMQSRNDSLKTSTLRFGSFMASLSREYISDAVGEPRQPPEAMRRQQIAFHRQQHDVDRHAVGQLADRVVEQSRAAVRVHIATNARGLALRGQAIGDEDDLVGPRHHRLGGRKGVDQARAVLRHQSSQRLEVARALRRVVRVLPLAGAAREHRRGPGIESVNLEFAVGRQLGDEPGRGVERAPPFGGGALRPLRSKLRSRITFTTSSCSMLAERSTRIRMRLPRIRMPVI